VDVKKLLRGPIFWIAMAVLFVLIGSSFISGIGSPEQVDTSVSISDIQSNNVDTATIIDRDQVIELTLKDGSKTRSSYVDGQGVKIQELLQAKADADQLPGGYNIVVPTESLLITLLVSLLPVALIVLLFFFLMSQMQGGGSKVMNFGKSKAKMITKDMPQTTFADVAGADEAVEELQEIKDFLADPAKFQAVGAKIPKGVLLYGPPGTGKTLLARAVAGEAHVPFFSLSGSEFVEMFVGVGAARIRDLFQQAESKAPCIVFIDELDALGKVRVQSPLGSHEEREQTLNQLLAEMDGFDARKGVIIMAATNRPEVLDPALLRPGRFDRQVLVDKPDVKGREAILRIHARVVKVAPGVDIKVVAARTAGFAGADLANLVNEAALLAARNDKPAVEMTDFEAAIDRLVAGIEKKRVMSTKERTIVAYHESGHAIVASVLPDLDPVHKISIVQRGFGALGYTMQLPL
jgi:cell division protease FtsH